MGRVLHIAALLAALASGAVAPARAEGDAAAGAEIFAARCAACHGSAGDGTGPMARVIAIPVPDLTGYAARSGGTVPVARTAALIEGDAVLRGHGGAMPVFGPVLGGDPVVLDGADGSPVQTTAAVANLIAFLETLQR